MRLHAALQHAGCAHGQADASLQVQAMPRPEHGGHLLRPRRGAIKLVVRLEATESGGGHRSGMLGLPKCQTGLRRTCVETQVPHKACMLTQKRCLPAQFVQEELERPASGTGKSMCWRWAACSSTFLTSTFLRYNRISTCMNRAATQCICALSKIRKGWPKPSQAETKRRNVLAVRGVKGEAHRAGQTKKRKKRATAVLVRQHGSANSDASSSKKQTRDASGASQRQSSNALTCSLAVKCRHHAVPWQRAEAGATQQPTPTRRTRAQQPRQRTRTAITQCTTSATAPIAYTTPPKCHGKSANKACTGAAPDMPLTISGAAIAKNGTPHSFAIACASAVLPQPGGPCSSTPRGGATPSHA